MRIIGGHDYYDIGMGSGHDDRVVFVREINRTLDVVDACRHGLNKVKVNPRFEDSASGEVLSRHNRGNFRHRNCDHDVLLLSVVLGDKQYSGIRIRRSPFMRLTEKEEICFWDLNSLTAWLTRHGVRAVDRRDDWRHDEDQAVPLADYFNVRTLPKRTVDYLVAQKMTLLTFMGEGHFDWDLRKTRVFWRVNGDDLKGMQFYKLLDAYTIFQEIEMWLGGVVAPEGSRIVTITDDRIKRDKHGFDQYSFRKAKQRV
jgi:hypothetical protein